MPGWIEQGQRKWTLTAVGLSLVTVLLLVNLLSGAPARNTDAAQSYQPAKAAVLVSSDPGIHAVSSAARHTAESLRPDPDRSIGKSGQEATQARLSSPHFSDAIMKFLYPIIADGFAWTEATRSSLEFYVQYLSPDLDENEIAALVGMIEERLQGEHGVKIADLVQRLYHLRRLESARFDAVPVPSTMEDMLDIEDLRQSLRRQTLGPDLYRAFYGAKPAEPSLASDTQGISAEIDQLRQSGESDEVIVAYIAEYEGPQEAASYQRLRGVERWWEQRYEAFLAERHPIDAAALDDMDKAPQIEALLRKHFKASELTAARAYDRIRQTASVQPGVDAL